LTKKPYSQGSESASVSLGTTPHSSRNLFWGPQSPQQVKRSRCRIRISGEG